MARPFLLSFVKLIANGGELVLGFRFIGSRAKVILPLPREQCVTSVVRSVGRIYISRDDPIFGPSVSFSSPPIFVPSPALSYRKNFFNLALNVQGGISLSFPLFPSFDIRSGIKRLKNLKKKEKKGKKVKKVK